MHFGAILLILILVLTTLVLCAQSKSVNTEFIKSRQRVLSTMKANSKSRILSPMILKVPRQHEFCGRTHKGKPLRCK